MMLLIILDDGKMVTRPLIADFENQIGKIYTYFNRSSIRQNRLKQWCDFLAMPELKFKRIFDIRWSSIRDCLRPIMINIKPGQGVYLALKKPLIHNHGLFQETKHYQPCLNKRRSIPMWRKLTETQLPVSCKVFYMISFCLSFIFISIYTNVYPVSWDPLLTHSFVQDGQSLAQVNWLRWCRRMIFPTKRWWIRWMRRNAY